MQTAFLMAALIAGVFASTASAQIVLDRSDFASRVGTYTATSYEIDLASNPGATAIVQGIIDNTTGPNQTYDFTGLTFTSTGGFTGQFTTNLSGLAGSDRPEFASANYASVFPFSEQTQQGLWEGTFYQYIELRDDAYLRLGNWTVTADSSYGGYGTPPEIAYQLPLTDGLSWTSSGMQTLVFPSGTLTLPSDTARYMVEGYGTLQLPNGITAAALRVRTQRGLSLFPSISYEFITRDGVGASITTSPSFFPPFTPVPSSADYTTTEASSVGTEGEDGLPESFALMQNYPNPFNPETVIPFELTNAGRVTLRVHDTLGRQVSTLVDRSLPAGRHEVSWQAGDLPSGVYMYSIEVGGTTRTRSLILYR